MQSPQDLESLSRRFEHNHKEIETIQATFELERPQVPVLSAIKKPLEGSYRKRPCLIMRLDDFQRYEDARNRLLLPSQDISSFSLKNPISTTDLDKLDIHQLKSLLNHKQTEIDDLVYEKRELAQLNELYRTQKGCS